MNTNHAKEECLSTADMLPRQPRQQQSSSSSNTSVCLHVLVAPQTFSSRKAQNRTTTLRISGFLGVLSSGGLCGMQDMKNVEERSTLSDLHHCRDTLFPLSLFQTGILASDYRVPDYKPRFFFLQVLLRSSLLLPDRSLMLKSDLKKAQTETSH